MGITLLGHGASIKTASKIGAVLIASWELMMTAVLVAVAVYAVNLALDMRR